MKRGQRPSAEQIVLMLRQIEVQTAQGKSITVACKEADVSEQTDSHWRKEYGGMKVEQARTMRDLKRENARLRRLVADLSLERQVLADVASGNLARHRAMPAGGRWHPGEVRPLGPSRLPDRRPAEHAIAVQQAIVAPQDPELRTSANALLMAIGYKLAQDEVLTRQRRMN